MEVLLIVLVLREQNAANSAARAGALAVSRCECF